MGFIMFCCQGKISFVQVGTRANQVVFPNVISGICIYQGQARGVGSRNGMGELGTETRIGKVGNRVLTIATSGTKSQCQQQLHGMVICNRRGATNKAGIQLWKLG